MWGTSPVVPRTTSSVCKRISRVGADGSSKDDSNNCVASIPILNRYCLTRGQIKIFGVANIVVAHNREFLWYAYAQFVSSFKYANRMRIAGSKYRRWPVG